jgi:hypothetical protein
MAQTLSYASDLPLSLGAPGWHRKYIVLPVAIAGICAVELIVRKFVSPQSVVWNEPGTGVLQAIGRTYAVFGKGIVAAYAMLLLVVVSLWLVLSVRVVRKTGRLGTSKCDPHDRIRLRRARLLLLLALIIVTQGLFTKMPALWYRINASM